MKQRVLAQRNILSKQRQIIRECSIPKRIQSTHTSTQYNSRKRDAKVNWNGARERVEVVEKETEQETGMKASCLECWFKLNLCVFNVGGGQCFRIPPHSQLHFALYNRYRKLNKEINRCYSRSIVYRKCSWMACSVAKAPSNSSSSVTIAWNPMYHGIFIHRHRHINTHTPTLFDSYTLAEMGITHRKKWSMHTGHHPHNAISTTGFESIPTQGGGVDDCCVYIFASKQASSTYNEC